MKIFHRALFLDTMKQLRLTGFLLMGLSALITAVGIGLNRATCPLNFVPNVPNISSSAIVLLPFVFLGVAALAFQAFGFLNKRSSSDFFHSLPITRRSLFFTLAAAVAVWMLATIAAVLSVEGLGYFLTGMPYDYSYLPVLLLFYTVTGLCVLSAALLGMSITGTRFSNLILTGLILFLPRLLFTLALVGIMERAQIITANDFGVLLNYSYHTPSGLIFSALLDGRLGISFDQMFSHFAGMGYTFALSLVQIGLACLLFCRRKSEMADRSAPNKVLQRIYQCACGLPGLLLLATQEFLQFGSTDEVIVTFCILFSVIPFFGFEVLTTKSAKKMLKSAPCYLAVAVVALLFSFGMGWGVDRALAFQPEADEIESVRFTSVDSYQRSTYLELLIHKISIQDEEAFAIVSDNLKLTADFVRSHEYNNYQPNCTPEWIVIRTKDGREVTRRVRIRSADYVSLKSILQRDPAYRQALQALPEPHEIVAVSSTFSYESPEFLEMWEIYRTEYASLPLETVLSLEFADYRLTHFSVVGTHDYTSFHATYPVTADTPQTARRYMALINQSASTAINLQLLQGTAQGTQSEINSVTAILLQHVIAPDTSVNAQEPIDPAHLQEAAQILLNCPLTSELTPTTLGVSLGRGDLHYMLYEPEFYVQPDEASYQRLMELLQ